ncbi:MAG: Rid family hydrolase [Acidobacteriota bacterium]
MYANLGCLLRELGLRPRDVLTEKLFFSDIGSQFRELAKIRQYFYGRIAENIPATAYLQQPPSHPRRLCELQAHAVLPGANEELKVCTVNLGLGLASGKLMEHRSCRHLYLMNLTGGGVPGDRKAFCAQAEDMFGRAESCLRRQGLSFRDVIRTWIYMKDIEGDYAAFNPVRTKFFQEHGVERFPASTGIQGGTFPGEERCAMDLYAMGGEGPGETEVMHAPSMNEASSYGSAFSRGLRVTREDRVVAYVSGTASVDESGKVLHTGDIEGQVRRMLLNVRLLLGAAGATERDIVSMITYLKQPGDLESFCRVCDDRSFPRDIPGTVCVADICRPEWLCEMEVIAMFPNRQ